MLEGGQKGSVAAFWFYLPPSLLERDNQNSHVVCSSYSHLGPCPLPLCLIVWTRIPGWTTLRSLPSHKI